MNIRYKNLLVVALLIVSFCACKKFNAADPNNPTYSDFITNASVDQLNNLVVGTESGMRDVMDEYLDDVSAVGREYYHFSAAEDRYVTDLLGYSGTILDNTAFYDVDPWYSRYEDVKNANVLILSAQNSQQVDDGQRLGYYAFANTIKAEQLLLNLDLMDKNGIRVDVSDPDHLGPFVTYDVGLDSIAGLLNQAKNELEDPSCEFIFTLTSGFAGFDDPAGFLQFNRALYARVQVYQKNWQNALNALDSSFYDLNGDIHTGTYLTYSTAAHDELNIVFFPRNSVGEVRVVDTFFIHDAEANDDRLQYAPQRDSSVGPATEAGLESDYDLWRYQSNTAPIPIIRNEELMLIAAEAKIELGDATGLDILNQIRQLHGVAPYSGATDMASLIDEMLNQRRYSLAFEGHRWIDMRRYGKLDELPIEREGDVVWHQFPIPQGE